MRTFKRALIIGLPAVLLVGSLTLNWFLFRRGRWYYAQLNALRLDPLGLGAYPAPSSQVEPATTDATTVVFFGDSRAATWPSPDIGGFAFINRGVGGETSAQGALRFDHHIEPLRPQIIVIQTGINDLKTIPLFPEGEADITRNCAANIEQIVAKSKGMGAIVIVTTIFPIGEVPLDRRPFWSDDVGAAIDEVNTHLWSLEGEGIHVLDGYGTLVGSDGKIKPEYSHDLLHLNDAGYERLNEELTQLLAGLR